MGVDHEGVSPPSIWSGGLSPEILACCKIFSTRLLALQCTKMCFFLPLQQDFYSKSRHYVPQNSSQIYAYGHSVSVSGVASYGALGHVPPSTSKSESQLSKYCVVCEMQMSTTHSSFDQYCISHKTISHRSVVDFGVRSRCRGINVYLNADVRKHALLT